MQSGIDDPITINNIKARLDETFLSETTLAAPTKYDLAVSVVCDIKCPYCPRQKIRDKVVSGFLKPEFFDPVVPYLKYSQRTGLYGLGEPFLNKNFFPFLAAAQATGTYTMTSSHGMSLDEATSRRILDSGLDELAVSIDGCTRKTFNYLREGADFDTVCGNVRRLIQMRNAEGRTKPAVHIACAISRANVRQMPGMVWLAKRLGADRLVFSNIIFVCEEDAKDNAVGTRSFRYSWAIARRLALALRLETFYFYQNPKPWNRDFPPIRAGARFGCPSAWSAYVVERDGNLKPCCYLDGSLGNAATGGDFGAAFNNDAAVALRRSLVEGNLNNNCRECGMLVENSPGNVERCLADAAAMIDQANLSDSTRAQLRALVEQYRRLAAERFAESNVSPAAVAPVAAISS